jgi:hypothetical protein
MENIPEFMRKYYDGTDPEGQVAIERLAGHFTEEKQNFYQTTFVSQSIFQGDWNKLKKENKQLNAEEALQPLIEKYEGATKEVAVKYGYVEGQKEQTQLDKARQEIKESKDLHPTHEDFIDNLASIRQRQSTQTHKPR